MIVACLTSVGSSTFASPSTSDESLLASLLNEVSALTAMLANVAENLHQVDGSVVIEGVGKTTDLVATLDAVARDHWVGPVSRVNSKVFSSGTSTALLDVLKPTTFSANDIATTAIGALQSGALLGSTGTTGTIDTSGLVNQISLTASTATVTTTLLAQDFGNVANTTLLQNAAINLGDVDGSIQMILSNTLAHVGPIGTTAIGSMESGILTGSLTANMNSVTDNLTAVVSALVGR